MKETEEGLRTGIDGKKRAMDSSAQVKSGKATGKTVAQVVEEPWATREATWKGRERGKRKTDQRRRGERQRW